MTEHLERTKDGRRLVGWRLAAALMALFWERLWPALSMGVGVALMIGVVRILKGWPIQWLIGGGYLVVVALKRINYKRRTN